MSGEPEPLPPATVLLVDDDQVIRDSVRRLLERMRLVVRTATDGADALRVFDEHRDAIQLVILDMAMPVMGGAECFRELRRLSAVPVLIATGYAHEAEVQELLGAGAALIEKPYRSAELRDLVIQLLGARAPAATIAS